MLCKRAVGMCGNMPFEGLADRWVRFDGNDGIDRGEGPFLDQRQPHGRVYGGGCKEIYDRLSAYLRLSRLDDISLLKTVVTDRAYIAHGEGSAFNNEPGRGALVALVEVGEEGGYHGVYACSGRHHKAIRFFVVQNEDGEFGFRGSNWGRGGFRCEDDAVFKRERRDSFFWREEI